MPRLLLARVLAPLPTPLNASDEREREEEELRLRFGLPDQWLRGSIRVAGVAPVECAVGKGDFDAPLIEFILEDVALNRELMQPDGIHPNAAGQKVVFANVWRVLGPLLSSRDAP